MHQRAKTVGIALEVCEIGPLLGRERILEALPLTLAEVGTYRLLARVAKGRIAQVMRQAGRCHYLAHVAQFLAPRLSGIFWIQPFGNLVGKRLAHATHLKAVGETVVHKDAAWQRKHLRFVLQAAEWRREHQAVVVALKVAAHACLAVVFLLQSQSLVAYQLIPVHG